MHKDIIGPSNEITQSLGTIRVEECADEVSGKGINVVWPVDLALKDLFIDAKGIVVIKWLQGTHLVNAKSMKISVLTG